MFASSQYIQHFDDKLQAKTIISVLCLKKIYLEVIKIVMKIASFATFSSLNGKILCKI